jgi:hypothetical protein
MIEGRILQISSYYTNWDGKFLPRGRGKRFQKRPFSDDLSKVCEMERSFWCKKWRRTLSHLLVCDKTSFLLLLPSCLLLRSVTRGQEQQAAALPMSIL